MKIPAFLQTRRLKKAEMLASALINKYRRHRKLWLL